MWSWRPGGLEAAGDLEASGSEARLVLVTEGRALRLHGLCRRLNIDFFGEIIMPLHHAPVRYDARTRSQL